MADDDFDKTLAEEQTAGRKARLEDAPPIGMGQDGKLILLKPGERDDFMPTIINADGEVDDLRAAYEAQGSEEDADPDDPAGEE